MASSYCFCSPKSPCVYTNTHTHTHSETADVVTSPSEIFDSDLSDEKKSKKKRSLIMGSLSHEK